MDFTSFDPWPDIGTSLTDTATSIPSAGLGGIWSSINSGAKAFTDTLSGAANAYLGWQTAIANLGQAKSATDIAKINAQASTEIAKAQAQHAVDVARNPNSIANWSADNIATAIANMNARLAGGGGSSNLMLLLTIAGVVFAGVQLMKKRG